MNLTPPHSGLTDSEVKQRIDKGLVNFQKKSGQYSVFKIVIENSFTAFNLINFLILSFIFFYYLRTRDNRLLWDSIGVVSVTFLNTVAGILQKIKAAKALEEIDLLKKYEITAIRNGEEKVIPVNSIVVDDLLFIQKGDQVPVDGEILEGARLQIDESLLTGESLPQDKEKGDSVLSGSFCVYGHGYFTAQKVGDDNYASKVTNLAKKYKLLSSPLMRKINLIFGISFVITIVMVLIEFIMSYLGGDMTVTEIRKISTIAFSLIPEGLVFFATITFTVGIFRISKIGAIVQKINAIDAFSTIKVVCMDKTGTITKNNIRIAKLTNYKSNPYSGDIEKILGSFSKLGSEQNATAKALGEYPAFDKCEMLDELPFRSDLKMSLIKIKFGDITDTFVLGAMDILTNKVTPEAKAETDELNKTNNLNGFRNLMFGRIEHPDVNIAPENIINKKIEPLCLISMKDEAREDAGAALKLFEQNQIQLKILSGDSSDSVKSTLDEIGWPITSNEIINGAALDDLSDSDFDEIILTKKLFARLKPEHKLRIVRSLRKQKIQTAFIGDGVNDLPAIKEADLGITMEEGSMISKQVSDIVLLNNRFSVLPEIFNEGNKIINTLRFVSRLYLTKNLTIFILSFLSWFFTFTYPLTPRKSALIGVLGVGLPCYLIALINTNSKRYPSFFRDIFAFILISSTFILGISFSVYYSAVNLFELSGKDASVMMFYSMAILSIVSFWATIFFDDPDNQRHYVLYTVIMLIVFMIFSVFKLDVIPFNWIKAFYEVGHISRFDWTHLAMVLVPGVLIFVFVQYIRSKIMNKYFYKNLWVKKF